jgi:hypothetical protein
MTYLQLINIIDSTEDDYRLVETGRTALLMVKGKLLSRAMAFSYIRLGITKM